MLNCRQVTQLVSQSMDTRLRWHERAVVRLHLLYCVWCRRYASQIRFLRKAARELADGADQQAPEKLPSEARAKIRDRLRQAMDDTSSPQ